MKLGHLHRLVLFELQSAGLPLPHRFHVVLIVVFSNWKLKYNPIRESELFGIVFLVREFHSWIDSIC